MTSKTQQIKALKKRVKELERRHKALFHLEVIMEDSITRLEERLSAVTEETLIMRRNATTSHKHLRNSLALTDETLDDVVGYLKALPKFQGGPAHAFRETKQNGNEEIQHHIKQPVSDD